MKKISLTNGGHTIVDDDCFNALSQFNWQLSPQGYVYRCESRNGRRKTILMHRVVAAVADGRLVDHINLNPLDNRRENLRPASRSLNAINSKPNSRNTSGYRNVTFRKDTGKWQAGLCRNRKFINLGSWPTPEQARDAVVSFIQTNGAE